MSKFRHKQWFKLNKHLFDIHLYSLKAYRDFYKSRLFRWLFRFGLCTDCYNSPIGLYLWLSSPKDFDKNIIDELNANDLKRLSKVCELHLFQKAKCYGRIGTFLGILVTHEDNYYILIDEYGNKWYETCVGKLEFLKN